MLPPEAANPSGAATIAAERPGPTTPPVNPFLPVGDIGAPQFISAHPTFDGRGITIGIIDDGVDLLTPELQQARLTNGARVPKVVDFITTTYPANPVQPDPTWVDVATQARAGRLATPANGPTATEQVVIPNPNAGRYVILVDAYGVIDPTSDIDFADVVTNPTWGSITVDDPPAFHPVDQPWSATFRTTPLAAPPDGTLGGFIGIESSGGELLWGGVQIELRNVS